MGETTYRKVLVTGGSGLLGQAFRTIGEALPEREFVFVDTKDCDLTILDQISQLCADYRPDAIMHLAAVSGGVGLSFNYPATLLRDNVYMNLNVLEAARLPRGQERRLLLPLVEPRRAARVLLPRELLERRLSGN